MGGATPRAAGARASRQLPESLHYYPSRLLEHRHMARKPECLAGAGAKLNDVLASVPHDQLGLVGDTARLEHASRRKEGLAMRAQ